MGSICSSVDGPGELSEVSRKEKDKYDITYIRNLKYNTDEHMYK